MFAKHIAMSIVACFRETQLNKKDEHIDDKCFSMEIKVSSLAEVCVLELH